MQKLTDLCIDIFLVLAEAVPDFCSACAAVVAAAASVSFIGEACVEETPERTSLKAKRKCVN
jgi:hypothetical protein